jgi:hypothetical protein
LDLTDEPLAAVIWCTGYGADFHWVDVPVFDGAGHPAHERGVTPSEGLYFIGLPWLHTWGSGRFCGVADDALEAAVHNACVRESGSCVNGRMHATHAGRLGDRCVRIQGCRRRCHRQQHPRGMLAQLRRVHDARLCTRQLRAS